MDPGEFVAMLHVMTRSEGRERAQRMAKEVGSGDPFLVMPKPQRRGRYRRKHDVSEEERLFFKYLSRRRRLEVLEPLVAENFRDLTVFIKRRTNITNVLISKYEELSLIGPMYFEGREGAEELYELFDWLRGVADQIVQRHSSADWLLLLRRAFMSPLNTTEMPPRWFLESFLRRSRRPPSGDRLVGRAFRASPRTLEDIHDVLMVTTAMWNVGQAFRTLSKGLVVTLGHPVIYVALAIPTDKAVVAAIGMYEARMTLWPNSTVGRPVRSVGVHGRRFAPEGGESKSGGAIGGWFEHGSEFDRSRTILSWRTHYFPEFIDPESVFGLGTGQQPALRSLAAAGVLWACWMDIGMPTMKKKIARGAWNLWGLHKIRISTLRSELERWSVVASQYSDSWDTNAAIAELGRTADELAWIDSGYSIVLPVDADHQLVDLVAACRALGEAHVRPPDGSGANAWTRVFEDQVQSVIDRSSWNPSDKVRQLIRRTIRVEGADLTDIDAVGSRDGELLLISVKAWTTPSNLAFGEFWAVNDRRKIVEKAVVDWGFNIDVIRRNPEILGIPIPQKIHGLVVTPDVPYVLGGPCTAEVVSGLLAVSTLAELDRCLNPDTYRSSARSSRSDY